MPDQDPDGPVARGMRALLARRDDELAAGARPVGWKIGFNTAAIQQHLGLSDPVVGYLVDTGVTPDGATVPVAGWTAPAVEVELAIRVGDDGGVAGLAPALELVDLDLPSRPRGHPRRQHLPAWRRLRRGGARRSTPGPPVSP